MNNYQETFHFNTSSYKYLMWNSPYEKVLVTILSYGFIALSTLYILYFFIKKKNKIISYIKGILKKEVYLELRPYLFSVASFFMLSLLVWQSIKLENIPVYSLFVITMALCVWGFVVIEEKIFLIYLGLIAVGDLLGVGLHLIRETGFYISNSVLNSIYFAIALFVIILLILKIIEIRGRTISPIVLPTAITALLKWAFALGAYIPWLLPLNNDEDYKFCYQTLLPSFGIAIVVFVIFFLIVYATSLKKWFKSTSKNITKQNSALRCVLPCFTIFSYIFVLPIYAYHTYISLLNINQTMINILWSVSSLFVLLIHFFAFAQNLDFARKTKALIIYLLNVAVIFSLGIPLLNLMR